VIGANDFIGQSLIKQLGTNAIRSYRTQTKLGLHFEIGKHRISDVIPNPKLISHAVILAGIINPAEVFSNPTEARRINVDATLQMIKELIALDIIPIYTSSDGVFGPGDGPFSEDAPINPPVMFGKFKREVEECLLNLSSEWLVLRLAQTYGLKLSDGTLLTKLFDAIKNGGKISLSSDHKFLPIGKSDVVKTIIGSINSGINRVYNLGGDEIVIHFDVATILLNEFSKFDFVGIKFRRKSFNDFVTYEKRPMDISMDSRKIKNTLNTRFINLADSSKIIVQPYLKIDGNRAH